MSAWANEVVHKATICSVFGMICVQNEKLKKPCKMEQNMALKEK